MSNRTERGRFVKGVSGNPKGRPKTLKADYLGIMANIVTPKKWAEIIERATKDAAKGNAAARKWIADYLLGRPVEHVKAEIKTTALTLEEWRKLAQERRDSC